MNHAGYITDTFSRDVLEFRRVIELLSHFLSGPLSEPRLETLGPGTEIDSIRRDLERVGEALEYLGESSRPSLGSLKNPRPTLERLAVEGASCSALEILEILEVARAAQELRGWFVKTPARQVGPGFTRLHQLVAALADFRGLVREMDGKILPDGSLDSSASPALARLRKSIEQTRQEVQSTLERLLRRLSKEGVLQDAVVSIRNDRFVLPVRTEEKRRVVGVVHGGSSSGATVFLEPLETVPLNNELVELQEREFAEVQRILAEFSDKLRLRRADLIAAVEILSEVDLIFAKAEFARQYHCCLPQLFGAGPPANQNGLSAAMPEGTPSPVPARRDTLSPKGARGRDVTSLGAFGSSLVLRDVRHPLLERTLQSQKGRPVPITVELEPPKTLVVISGPNTGGKTVALKTIGISVLMAQAGLPVAASEARLPLFGRVLADIGDQQSIEASLSTFSAHITNIEAMARVADRNDLVLLDELGGSTDPNEGAALAVAILEHFRERGAVTIVTTHHSRLKAYAADTAQAINAAVDFDEITLQPTYRLLLGLPGKSSGLDIARRLGLEGSIVEKARTLLDPTEAQTAALVASLHEQKATLERELARLAEERKEFQAQQAESSRRFEAERRAKLRELDARLEETLRLYEKRWEKTITEIRSRLETSKTGKRLERRADVLQREVREEWNAQVLEVLGAPAEQPAEPEVIDRLPAVGDSVRLANIPTPGKVIGLAGDQVEVEVGRLHTRVRKDEVRVLNLGVRVSVPPPESRTPNPEPRAESAAEINVIGSTAEEARERVDKFLDDAYMAGRFRLRVVHGHGKNILKNSLHEMFASHPHVEKFYPAPPQEGGTGATIVELKL
jgi:DNA mismatch repair protein MutS2